ncbi:hypothetical protein AB0C21_05220 [Spirillospora sp. NPDC049024]
MEESGWAPWARRPEELPEALFAALAAPRAMGFTGAADPAAIIVALATGRDSAATGRPASMELSELVEASR